MAGNEWVVRVTADVKGVLDASRQIGQAGKQAGKDFEDGFKGNENTLTGLRSRLTDLNKTLDQAAIGSKEFTNAQKAIAQTQGQVDSALSKGNGILGGLKNGFKDFALQAGGVLAVGAALQKTSEQIIELDKASAAVRTLGVDSKDLSSKLLNLSVELDSNISRADLMKAAYDVASSGFSTTTQITDIMRASALGAKGGFAELGDVTKAVTGVINAYGLTTDSATGIIDGFVQTQADGVITVREYAAQIGTVASVAAAAEIPISEMNAAIATATLKGVPVEQAFTGIRQAISSILKPSAEATALANSLGIEFNLSGLKAKGFGGLLAEVQTKTGGAADKLAILLGSVEAQAAVQPIVNDGLKKYNELLDNQKNSSGAAAEASKIATETLASGFEKISNAASNLATSVNTALPSAGTSFSELAKLINLTAKTAEVAGPSIGKALTAAFAPLSSISNIPGFNNLINTSLDWLLKLNAGNKELTAEQSKQVAVGGQINETKTLQSRIDEEIKNAAKEVNRLELTRLETAQALLGASNRLVQAQNDGQIKVGQASISLGQALIGLEGSRFDIIRNRNDYELQEAQKRGASEQELDAIRRQADAIDRAALDFKYKALLEQQNLQRSLLALQQEGAALEADLASNNARLEVDKASLKLQSAELAGNKEAIAQAELGVQIAELGVQSADSKLQILAKTQPIEAQIAAANGEAAQNQLKAEAASKGLALAADGTFKAAKNTADQFKTYGNSLKVPLSQQGSFADLAKSIGLQVRDTGKGYFEIGKTLGKDASPAANNIRDYMGTAAKATGAARSQAAGLATNMNNAAGAAQSFYNALAAASGLPDARFTGGPVDAGQTYRINDGPSGMSLGQESFLSASGALSLINRPMNSLWTAPSKGTVIPAHVTSRLKEAGALGGAGVLRAGPDPAMAHLAMAVGNLSREVAELRRKAWNVSVGVRGDGSALKLQQTMQRIR